MLQHNDSKRVAFQLNFNFLLRSKGIFSVEGEFLKEQRRFIHTVLKDLGMGKGILEPKILEEVEVCSNSRGFLDEFIKVQKKKT